MAEGKLLADARGCKWEPLLLISLCVSPSLCVSLSPSHRWVLALISRRSCLHPGTRYLARGLNSAASPGNEVECEQLVWTQAAAPGACRPCPCP
jgi:hypothetical protein